MPNVPRVDPTELLASVEQAEAVISNLRKHLSSLVSVLDATLPEPGGHIWHDCKVNGHVGNRPEEHCLACDGGLSGCVVCGQWEGAIEDVCPGQKPNPLLESRFDAKVVRVDVTESYDKDSREEGPIRRVTVVLHHAGSDTTCEVYYALIDGHNERFRIFLHATGLGHYTDGAGRASSEVPYARLPGRSIRAEMDAKGNVDIVGEASGEASW